VITDDELLRLADAMGLGIVARAEPAMVRRALASANEWVDALPRDLDMGAEPAHVYGCAGHQR
jgi:hypothetical protein